MKKPKGFWAKLKKPIYTLAPMMDITDAAFRKLIARHGKPDVLFTEFISCDGLCSPGKPKLIKILKYDNSERPLVAQIFGKNPETYFKTAQIIDKLGFDGIDINMGCPEKNILKQGSGASLIDTPDLAKELIAAAKEGAGDLPISVKTRMGLKNNVIEKWVANLLEAKPEVITMHFRTAKEMSKGKAHWDQIDIVVELAKNSNTLVIGNGDIMTLEEADMLVEEKGIDGIMFGRAIFGNPWLFNRKIKKDDISIQMILDVMVEHAQLYHDTFKDEKPFYIIRKHLWAYASGFVGAKELRVALESTHNVDDVKNTIEKFKNRKLMPPRYS